MKRKNIQNKRSGFTLIELLLYVVIAAMLLLSVSFFMQTLLEARVKNQTVSEVDQQGIQIAQLITQTIRNAVIINTPVAGASATSLSVNTPTSGNNPTVFDLSGGVIRSTEGAGSPIPITNSRVIASSLSITNLSRAGTPGTIRVLFTLTATDGNGRAETQFAKNFMFTASLR